MTKLVLVLSQWPSLVTHLILSELRNRWIWGLPRTLLCSLDHLRQTKTIKTRKAPTAPDENQEEDKKKPSPEDILLTLRVQVDSCSPAALLALTTIRVEHLQHVRTACSGNKLSEVTFTMSLYLSPIANSYSLHLMLPLMCHPGI